MPVFQKEIVQKIVKSKPFIWTVSLPFVAAIFILTYFLNIKDLIIFPNSAAFNYNFYTDNATGGNSEITQQVVNDSLLRVDFKLKNGIASPYIGITISPKSGSVIQLNKYNELIIKIKGTNFDNLNVAFFARNPYSEKIKKSPEISFYTILKISSTLQTYTLDFSSFNVPDWWYELNSISQSMIRKPAFSAITNLNIANAYSPMAGENQSLQISSLAFSRNNGPLALLLLLSELGVFIAAFIVRYSIEKSRLGKKTITITYQPVEQKSMSSSRSDFIDFMNRNFQNSQLTLEIVSGETGVSQRRITNEIQSRFNCNFKSYINRLRINESKRLLLESNLNIGEIAFKVGFNNQSHFNRVFKSELQISPTEYREQHRNR